MYKLLAIVGFTLLVVGNAGLYITTFFLEWGSVYWVLSNITSGTFSAVGLGILIYILITVE